MKSSARRAAFAISVVVGSVFGAACSSSSTSIAPANVEGETDADVGPGSDDDAAVDAGHETGAAGCGVCDGFGAFSKTATIPYALDELSGLAVSRTVPDIFYAHNDSGDSARFFAFGIDGSTHGEFALADATAIDWEDVATGPCDDGSACLFLADIGDNNRKRQTGDGATPGYAIYVLPEPKLDPAGDKATVAAEKLAFLYPDGPHNAETLLVDPRTGDIFVVTKIDSGESAVYQYPKPLRPAETVTLEKVADWLVPDEGNREITAGDIHPCARRIVLRTYDDAYELVGTDDMSMADLLAVAPRKVTLILEKQGEAITYAADGRALFTSTELGNAGPPPHRAVCK